jgi:ubiquinone biosynthesis monooxygenase Coq7
MENTYDISVIRPQMKVENVKFRGEGFTKKRLKSIKKALLTLHTLEIMATNIYRFQITKQKSELNKELIAAMCNEMTHIQDFEIKLYEYGLRPTIKRYAYLAVGFCFGFFSRLLGEKAILRVGVWVESKAVSHYSELLENIDWDEETRKVVEKDQADEGGHISRWKALLAKHK